MHPAWARVFEPPCVTGGESQGVMRILMTLYRETGDKKYLEPIPRALEYLKRSEVPRGTAEIFRRIPPGPVLARFYELKTNKPLYITKGSRLNAASLGSRIVDGYEISYSPESVITHYGVLITGRELASIEEDYRRVSSADPKTLRRPDKLHGLSPWSERPRAKAEPAAMAGDVKRLIESMDERGAWTKMGTIGKADRVVFAYAARPMVLRLGRGRSDGSAGDNMNSSAQIIQLKENDTVEIFAGPQPPVGRSSLADFARNLTRMGDTGKIAGTLLCQALAVGVRGKRVTIFTAPSTVLARGLQRSSHGTKRPTLRATEAKIPVCNQRDGQYRLGCKMSTCRAISCFCVQKPFTGRKK